MLTNPIFNENILAKVFEHKLHIMKKMIPFSFVIVFALAFTAQKINKTLRLPAANCQLPTDMIHFPDEKHFKNVQQLTFGGDNAEAYWSFDSKWIAFQRTNPKEGLMCDQIFMGRVPQKPGDKFEYKMISTGKRRCTCSFFAKDGTHV